MIGGLVTLKNMFKSIGNEKDDLIEVQIKTEICDLLLFFLNLRMDYLISNFLVWFDEKGINNYSLHVFIITKG